MTTRKGLLNEAEAQADGEAEGVDADRIAQFRVYMTARPTPPPVAKAPGFYRDVFDSAREPTKTEVKVAEAVAGIPEIREAEGFVNPLRFMDETYPPVGEPEKLAVDDPAFLAFIDGEMDRILGTEPKPEVVRAPAEITPEQYEKMKEVFADMVADKEKDEPKAEPERDLRPGKDKMMSLSGGLYLPVRRRVAWMRGEPVPQPSWGIVNTLLKYEMGTLEAPRGGGPGGKMPKITGGYAVVKSEIIDEMGRIISTGYAQERSEVFPDFIEKAETAAVGRAAALAGFGTEAALDLDEGLAEDNVVDAPVRPIVIGEGIGSEVKVGGRVAKITNAQLKEIARLIKSNEMDPEDVAEMIKSISGVLIPDDALVDTDTAGPYLLDILRQFTNAQAATMIGALMEAGE